MCFNCGCHIPQDNMGNPDNITEDTIQKLAEHWADSVKNTKKRLLLLVQDPKLPIKDTYVEQLFLKAAKSWGQSEEKAKENTASLLKTQLS